MQQPIHAVMQPASRWTTERVVGVGFVGVLHVVAIWAILSGLAQQIVRAVIPPDIQVIALPTKPPEPVDPVKVPTVVLPTAPTTEAVQPPIFTIQRDDAPQTPGGPTSNPPTQAVADQAVAGITNTHTSPDYPLLARRLEEQGSVRLGLRISAAGDITAANVLRSSGFADLDQAAIAWVLAHWKYKPAIQGGVAVPSQSLAVVVFNLKNAR